MRLTDRAKALSLIDTLTAEGFTVKLCVYPTYRCEGPLPYKRDGGTAFEVYVLAHKLSDAVRIQSVVQPLGLEAWICNDEDGHASVKIEIDLGVKGV